MLPETRTTRTASGVGLWNPTFLIALSACLGCILLALANLYRDQVVGWVVAEPEQTALRMRVLLALLASISVLPAALLGLFAGRLSSAVTRAGRYPPPGVALRRRARIREGQDAYRAARMLRIVAIALGGVTVLIPVGFWLLAARITPS